MEKWENRYQPPTEAFPLAVHYYRPRELRDAPTGRGRHPEVEFVLIHRGRVYLQIQDRELILEEGQIGIINPYELHSYQSLSMDVVELTVRFPLELVELPHTHFFYREFVEPLRRGARKLPSLLTPDHPIYPEAYHALCRFSPDMEQHPGYRQRQLAAVFSLCTALAAYSQPDMPPQEAGGSVVKQCRDYLSAHYAEKLTLTRIAQEVGVHPNYLSNRFREVTGQTVFGYLTDVRLEKAWRLLGHSDITVGEVCSRCGFNNMGYFNRKYKERYGVTPREYRKQEKFTV